MRPRRHSRTRSQTQARDGDVMKLEKLKEANELAGFLERLDAQLVFSEKEFGLRITPVYVQASYVDSQPLPAPLPYDVWQNALLTARNRVIEQLNCLGIDTVKG